MNKTLLAMYYDNETQIMLSKKLTIESQNYIKENNENLDEVLFNQWNTIVNSLPSHYYNQYLSKTSQEDRNNWFRRYLDYPTKDISLMPEWL